MGSIAKRIVCLANSRKLSERCVAGRELSNGYPKGWIRPVSDRETGVVERKRRKYKDGSDAKVLDIIDVQLIEAMPHNYQTENWLLDPKYYWAKRGRFEWNDLDQLADPVSDLWTNGQSSEYGENDRVNIVTANKLDHSLRLIRLPKLQIFVGIFGSGRRQVKARFNFNRRNYRLTITDPIYEKKYKQMENGEYDIDECFVTISLGEPFRGFCYKLVSAIIEPPQ